MASPLDELGAVVKAPTVIKPTQEGAPKQTYKEAVNSAAQAAIEDPTITAAKAELLALEIEEKKLALRVQKANLEDMEQRLAERELKREAVRQEAYTKGATLGALSLNKGKHQKRCNHKKGGNGANGIVGGKGDAPDYAVAHHTFANGDTWVKCLRCHKTWKPPVRKEHKSIESYEIAQQVYRSALELQTRNTPSGGVQFRYSDGGEHYREVTSQVTLG